MPARRGAGVLRGRGRRPRLAGLGGRALARARGGGGARPLPDPDRRGDRIARRPRTSRSMRATPSARLIVIAGDRARPHGGLDCGGDAPLQRHHVRLPDERPRLRAHEGAARVAGPRRGDRARGSRRARVQHLHDPREGRRALPRAPDGRARGEAARPLQGDRRRRLLVGVDQGRAVRAVSVRRPGLRPGQHLAPRRVHPGRGRRAARALLDVRRVLRRPADAPRAAVPGLAADLAGLQLDLLVLHRPVRARPRAVAARRTCSSPRPSASRPRACAS